METTPKIVAVLTLLLATAGAPAQAGKEVVLRATDGRFLRPADGGVVLADRLFPTEHETFELLQGEGDGAWLRTQDGRFLVVRRSVSPPPPPPNKPIDKLRARLDKRLKQRRAEPPPPVPVQRLRLVPLDSQAAVVPDDQPIVPPEQAMISLVPTEGNLAAVKAISDGQDPAEPHPEETLEIYRAGNVPDMIRSTLAMVIGGLVVKELDGKEYDKVESRLKEKFIELPAPTLKDPDRKKKHRVLAYREETHVKAQLAGKPEIRITHMPYLKGHFQQGSSVLMFVVEAVIPVKGRVNYKIPDRLSATTGFETTIAISMVGQVRIEKSKDGVSVPPPELLDIRIALDKLRLSNDILDAARRPIENVINRQLHKKNDRIRQQANKTLAKAVEAQEFRHPLLRFITLP